MIIALIILYVMFRGFRPCGYYGYRGLRFYRRPMFFSPFFMGPRPPMGHRGPHMGPRPRGPFGM